MHNRNLLFSLYNLSELLHLLHSSGFHHHSDASHLLLPPVRLFLLLFPVQPVQKFPQLEILHFLLKSLFLLFEVLLHSLLLIEALWYLFARSLLPLSEILHSLPVQSQSPLHEILQSLPVSSQSPLHEILRSPPVQSHFLLSEVPTPSPASWIPVMSLLPSPGSGLPSSQQVPLLRSASLIIFSSCYYTFPFLKTIKTPSKCINRFCL